MPFHLRMVANSQKTRPGSSDSRVSRLSRDRRFDTLGFGQVGDRTNLRCSDPGCHFAGKGDSSIRNRIRRPEISADDDCPVRRSHQVHGRSAMPTQPKVLDSTFRRISCRSRVDIVCLNHEDLPTAKIVERYVAGWISTRGYHDSPGKRRRTTPRRFVEVFTRTDERNGTGQRGQSRSIGIEYYFGERGLPSGVAYPGLLASGFPANCPPFVSTRRL